MKNKWILGALLGGSLWLPHLVQATNADLAIDDGSITFSTSTFYSGDTVRIYARVRNPGDVDMQASVVFYNGTKVVGATQPVSLRADGAPEEVFVDFLVPSESFNIHAVIAGASPTDTNPANDEATTVLYTTIADADKDGVLDKSDNCPNNVNADQADKDSDGIGDVCDSVDNTPKPVVVAEPVVTPVVKPTTTAAPTTASTATTKAPAATGSGGGTTSSSAGSSTSGAVVASVAGTNEASTGQMTSASSSAPTTLADGTPRPNKAFGIFDNALAADGQAVKDDTSFWHLSNPAVQILLVILGLGAIGCLTSVIVVRRRAGRVADNDQG